MPASSLRSEPIARRSARRRSRRGSTPVTTPSPKAAWATSSPIRNCGAALGGALALGGQPAGRRRPPRPAAAGRARAPRSCTGCRSRAVVVAVGQLGRDLVEEAAAQAEALGAEQRAPPRVGQRQRAHRARDADVAEPPLLLERALVERARVREDALLAADDEDDRVLEALRVVERHQRDQAAVVACACRRRRRARSARGTRRGRRRRRRPASNSRATPTSSSRFSIRPCASNVRSASSASR